MRSLTLCLTVLCIRMPNVSHQLRMIKRAALCENGSSDICGLCSSISACASAQSYLLSSQYDPSPQNSGQCSSPVTDVQADLELHCPHMSEDPFSHDSAHLTATLSTENLSNRIPDSLDLRSDCRNAQAVLELHCPHMFEDHFCMTRLIWRYFVHIHV